MSDNLVDLSLNLKNSQSAQLPPAKKKDSLRMGEQVLRRQVCQAIDFQMTRLSLLNYSHKRLPTKFR